MKKVLAVLLLAVLLVGLCACTSKNSDGSDGTKGAGTCEHQYTGVVTKVETCQEEGVMTYTCSKCKDSYTEAIKTQDHIYMDADCVTAKTCVNCNTVQGRAKGHNYIQGVCTRCKGDQPGYKALESNTWETMGITFAEDAVNELDVIHLCFTEDGAYLRAYIYGLLSDLSEEEQEEYNKNPDELVVYKKKTYYYRGFFETCAITIREVEDNFVTLEFINGKNVGYIIMERKSADKYTVTEVTGIIYDDIVTSCIAVGSNFLAVG